MYWYQFQLLKRSPRLLLIALFIILASAVGLLSAQQITAAENPTVITVSDSAKVTDVKRLGINIGSHSQWGASQILKNLIVNPGFEAGEFAMIFNVAEGATSTRVQADNWDVSWNNDSLKVGQPIAFWAGAEYEVLTGAAAGRTGSVSSFTHDDDKYTFTFANDGLVPETAAAVIVRKAFDRQITTPLTSPIRALNPIANRRVLRPASDIRPGSLGQQSLRLKPSGTDWEAAWSYYMDSQWRDGDTSMGKLMIVEGEWQFSIWAKGQADGDTLRVRFHRENEASFLEQTAVLTTDWQRIEYNFNVDEGADKLGPYETDDNRPILALQLFVDGTDDVWIDDIALGRRNQTNPTVFSDKFVAYLTEVNPGILRDWGNQLGSTLDNQLAPPDARKTTSHSPAVREAYDFHYSLHEFLELAAETGAEPWYVVPPTFSDAEWQNLIAYLSAPINDSPYANKRVALGQLEPWTDVFSTIHLEHGNEMWGSNDASDAFIGGTIRGGERLGQAADRKFAQAKSSPYFSADNFNLIIGGQAGYTPQNDLIENNSDTHNSVALAPYFGELDNWDTDETIFYPLFAGPLEDVSAIGPVGETEQYLDDAGQGTEQAIYEINFHTTTGDAPIDVRNNFVTSLAGGLALPLHMLTYIDTHEITNQAAFTTLQSSYQMDNDEYAKVWGVLRDLEATGRKRPTSLGLELANRAIRAQLLSTAHSGENPLWTQTPFNDITQTIDVPYLQSFAFNDADTYSLMVFNLSLDTEEAVQLALAHVPTEEVLVHTLKADSIHDDNETTETVTIDTLTLEDFNANYTLTLAPHSATVLEWQIKEPTAISLSSSYASQANDLFGILGLVSIFLILFVMAGLVTFKHSKT